MAISTRRVGACCVCRRPVERWRFPSSALVSVRAPLQLQGARAEATMYRRPRRMALWRGMQDGGDATTVPVVLLPPAQHHFPPQSLLITPTFAPDARERRATAAMINYMMLVSRQGAFGTLIVSRRGWTALFAGHGPLPCSRMLSVVICCTLGSASNASVRLLHNDRAAMSPHP
jgi:hypothetical protein